MTTNFNPPSLTTPSSGEKKQLDRSKSPLLKHKEIRQIPGRLMTKDLVDLYKECPSIERPMIDV